MARLEASALTKRYSNGKPALEDATFVYEGSGAIGYLGPNGAGKTTTLKLFTGLLRPTRGQALINGARVDDDRKVALADVGAVIETPEPYPTQTVSEAVEMIAEFRAGRAGDIAREIGELSAKLDLPPLTARTGRLSKGQRQRVALAASLIRDPKIILLDEPTSGLDPSERILVRNLLNDLKKDHLILMSSHLMQEVTEICDQVIFVNAGTIVLRDTVSNVAARFQTRQVDVEFASDLPLERLSALGSRIRTVTPISRRRYRIEFDGSNATRAEILAGCVQLGPVLSFASASLALEDAYLALMQGDPATPAA